MTNYYNESDFTSDGYLILKEVKTRVIIKLYELDIINPDKIELYKNTFLYYATGIFKQPIIINTPLEKKIPFINHFEMRIITSEFLNNLWNSHQVQKDYEKYKKTCIFIETMNFIFEINFLKNDFIPLFIEGNIIELDDKRLNIKSNK